MNVTLIFSGCMVNSCVWPGFGACVQIQSHHCGSFLAGSHNTIALALLMPPKKQSVLWTAEHAAVIIQRGFRELGRDPHETGGKEINTIIKGDQASFEILQPFFSKAQGGTKGDNNQIYSHYKNQASEYITLLAKCGTRKGRT